MTATPGCEDEARRHDPARAHVRAHDGSSTSSSSSPDPTGHSSTTYVYRTAARLAPAPPVEEGGSDSHTMGWIALGLLLAAGLPLAAVLWARS